MIPNPRVWHGTRRSKGTPHLWQPGYWTVRIYSKLLDGYVVNKAEEATRYGVNERSIQRDIDSIRNFLDEDSERTGIINTVIYDRNVKGYRLETIYQMKLQNSEVLALCKILLDSRAFTKLEMTEMWISLSHAVFQWLIKSV
jgi:hypothetical protein